MIGNRAKELVNAPGTAATMNLAGAPAGFVTIGTEIASGQPALYAISDGTQTEVNTGTYTAGAPNTLARGTTPIWTSSGVTTRLNFTGQASVYLMIPAERSSFAIQQAEFSSGSPSTITLPIPTLYRRLTLEFYATGSVAGVMYLRFFLNGAGSPNSGASDYSYVGATIRAAGVVAASATTTYVAIAEAPSAAGGTMFGTVEIDVPALRGIFDSSTITAGPLLSRWSGTFNTAFGPTLTGISLGIVGGTFVTGRVRLLGGQ